MPEIKCPSCSIGLRIPDGSGTIACPRSAGGCGTRFKYPFVQRSSIAFRCACNGGHFNVTLQRKPKAPKFVIERIATVGLGGTDRVAAEVTAYNADVYDFTGFYCACCGYHPGDAAHKFVKCGRCKELVCGAQIYEKLDTSITEALWFSCYPECGNHGPIVGRIEEYDALRTEAAERVASGLLKGAPTPLKIAGK